MSRLVATLAVLAVTNCVTAKENWIRHELKRVTPYEKSLSAEEWEAHKKRVMAPVATTALVEHRDAKRHPRVQGTRLGSWVRKRRENRKRRMAHYRAQQRAAMRNARYITVEEPIYARSARCAAAGLKWYQPCAPRMRFTVRVR